jgi:citrate lyase beta subunit
MDLFVFTADPSRAAAVVDAGAAGVILDWERRGKARRQRGQDTQINEDTAADLAAVRAAVPRTRPGRILCRVNGAGPWTAQEVQLAVDLGVDEVLLPMVRTPADVDLALDAVAGRCGLGILVETQAAVDCVEALARRPLHRVYLGLNDLRIDRGGADPLFAPLVDGTAARVRSAVDVPFGVAGLTLPDGGHPVPTRLLAGALADLEADFTFLRRSFWADTAGHDLRVAVPRIVEAWAAARRRSPAHAQAELAELRAACGSPLVAQSA